MPPAVSVIIPAFNRAGPIVRAIQSVRAQTFQDLEVIVVDDGSTDQTGAVVQQIGDTRIRTIRHAHNLGAAEARNTGMKVATGKYIAWLDSDDEWLCDKLQIQLDALVQAAPDQKACYTAFERIDQRNGTQVYNPQFPDRKELFMGCDLSPGSTLLFERAVLEKIGYLDPSLIRYEDWDWLLRYCREYRLYPIDQPLARIHFTPERSAKSVETSANKIVSKYSDELRQFGAYRNIVISKRWIEVARYYAQEHNLAQVARYVVKGLSTYPFQPLEMWAMLIKIWFGINKGLLPLKIRMWINGGRD
jgi:glycosyltransferase involved in cell wall biosynthesis